MSWALKGLAGPLKDCVIPLKSGLTLGRQAEVVIPDIKASSIHARISQLRNGLFILEDNNSKNGTRIDGERVARIELVNGLTFHIGDQGFQVTEIVEETVVARSPRKAPVPEPVVVPQPPPDLLEPSLLTPPPPPPIPDPPKKQKRYWYDVLADFLEKNKAAFSERKRPLSPLDPALVLEFVRGVQVNSRWTLGYGPRKIGTQSLDLPIWEPGAPTVCFEIFPSSDGIMFSTAHPELVQLNGQGVDSQVLRVGDTIRILETMIEVDFTE